MDIHRFDVLTRSLVSSSSRRGVLRSLLAGSALSLTAPLAFSLGEAEARKKRKKRKKKRGSAGGAALPEGSPSGSPRPTCVPRCAANRPCGSDGCDGSCGSCAGNENCQNGTCVCVPQCAANDACGPDGCGGSCGNCAEGTFCQGTSVASFECVQGVCTRVTESCGGGDVCFEGTCCERQPASSCREFPEEDGCGGAYPANCPKMCCDLACDLTAAGATPHSAGVTDSI
jgi:hypothetical protein